MSKTPRFGARPSGNRPEICVGWLSKHGETKAFTVEKQLYPRSHILVSFDGNPRGISTDFSCHRASKPGSVGTFRANNATFTASREGISPRPKFRAIFQVVRHTFVARDSVSADRATALFWPSRYQNSLDCGLATVEWAEIPLGMPSKRPQMTFKMRT